MAAGNAIRHLQEETTCAVCLAFFQDAVMMPSCGRSLCRRCPQRRVPFPHGAFRPSRQLASVVAALQELCHSHQRALTLFCRRDGVLVCTACADPAVPLEEAARWYRESGSPSQTLPRV